jgi:hypothetical protein
MACSSFLCFTGGEMIQEPFSSSAYKRRFCALSLKVRRETKTSTEAENYKENQKPSEKTRKEQNIKLLYGTVHTQLGEHLTHF